MGTQKSFQESQRLRLDRDYFTRSGRGLRRPSLAWPSLSYLRPSSQMHARRYADDRPRGPRPQARMRTISPNQSPEPTLTIGPFFLVTSPLETTSFFRVSVAHL